MADDSPRLPAYVAPSESLSRPNATSINRTQGFSDGGENRQSTLTITGLGRRIPVVYGEARVPGYHLVAPRVHNTELLMAVAWSWGECEGVQTMYINGDAVPAGVTLTHYTGTDAQTADPTLSAAIPGFGDTFAGVAYTVISVPTGTVSGFPNTAQIEAVFRGRLLFDPRDSSTSYGANPGLAIADFVQSTDYGPGLTISGVADVADRCDEIVDSTEVRSQIGLSIRDGQRLDNWLDVLSTYAECLWAYDGDGVLLVPDAPGSTVATISLDDVVENSFQFQGQSLDSAPTVVTVTYRPSTGTAEQWRDEPKEVRLPEVDSGDAPEIRSDVSMPGIERESEAERKAITRLRRLQFPAKYAWQMHDAGIKFQRGDIVQLPDQRGLTGWLVRILSLEMMRSSGIYQITAEHYDPAIYPNDYTPTSETTIPVGGIVTYSGNTAPSGWAFWTDADGRLLRGAGTESAGATGGDNTVSISGTTSDAGGHSGDQDMTILDNTITIGGDAARFNNITEDDHNHAFSGTTEAEPLYRQTRFIEKTGSAGQLPSGGGVFAGGELIAAALSEASSHIGRVVKAGSSHDTGGQNYSKAATVSLVDAGEHNHQGSKDYIEESGTQFSSPQYTSVDVMLHGHPGSTVNVSFDIARKRVAHYIATASSDIIPGCIILLKPGVSIPSGWHVCDGNNGTIDLQDFFPQLSSANDANTTVGSNSGASWSGTTEPGGAHNHDGGSVSNTKPKQVIGHVTDVPDHDHTMSGSDAGWLPEYYVVRFIEYTGVA